MGLIGVIGVDFNDFNAQRFTPTRGFVPRGRGNRGRGLRGSPNPQQSLRRQDLVDEIMNQVEERERRVAYQWAS